MNVEVPVGVFGATNSPLTLSFPQPPGVSVQTAGETLVLVTMT